MAESDQRKPAGRGLGRRRAFKILACGVLLLALLVPHAWVPSLNTLPEPLQKPAAATAAALDQVASGLSTIVVVVRRNDTLDQIFRKLALSLSDLANLRAIGATRQLLDRLIPGEQLTLVHRDSALVDLQRNISLTEQLQVHRADDGFHASVVPRPIEIRPALARGTIHSSLFESANAAGLQDATVLKLARIFGWDIDFVLDLRAGDAFVVSYEHVFQNGQFVQDGEILAARFINQGRTYEAVRYQDADGTARYYTPDGRSMEKAFLRAPLEFTRVSSVFSTARFHPILNRIRAHQGTDYAAPIGTPVHAAGAGHISFRGWAGGYGNEVQIDHGGGIVTLYGHLSRFAPQTRPGAHVAQGDTIAFVGMTGLATGPHLHYEYRLNGRFQDPQKVKLPDATPIDAALRPAFLLQTAPLLAALDPPSPALLPVKASTP
ncbi:MAG: peptidoglycan DD-metalloendopeptidase family protein [Steroidobacteraceae bacterium]